MLSIFDRIAYSLSRLFHDYKKIIVLGMPSAGKTRFLCQLNGKEYQKTTTAIEKFEYFKVDVESDTIYIDNGRDIGGTSAYKPRYKEFISDADIVFFIFDINKYLNDKKYQDETHSRIDLIYTYLQVYHNKCCIIGSHLDIYLKNKGNRTQSTAFQEINTIIYNEDSYTKEYRILFKDNETFFIEDLTQKESALKILSYITQN